ncbi:TonB-dependent receptor [Ectothiorhodospira lacustris]|uniref:TonB-dependent receptor n=1 Tax=Ectothiorhodospira lacustris TaxID=2899127 RepID=UPI001EE84B35|nr:TonB-dependent receptor [Ectothiorhodospira lacustris]MCG5511136.1 TonB-dependent receptor [Ectothiorhodospira lacustris]MCG5522800.1 TonB-dependent receptor [Ectothiorhodospira lacustris]
MAFAIGACGHSWAADRQPEIVEVIGQAAQLEQALEDQRRSNAIKSVVHADGIGQLPDDNAAEALQRVPGLSVERDQGEGRFVRVRGLGSDLNSVTINGTLVPAPEDDRRAVALDVLPSELIQSLSVVKTLTPDMDANSIGGTIEVESLSGFDHDGLFYSLNAEGSYDDNTSQTSPKLSGAFSNRFSLGGGVDNLAVAAAFSWQRRDFGSDNVETGGAWDFDNGPGLEEVEQRRYDITRERAGLGLNFDYRPDEDSEIYLRTLYSRYQDDEVRQASIVEFEEPQMSGQLGTAEAARELKAREETQEVKSLVLGGKRRVGDWTLSAQGGYSQASEKSPVGLANAAFVGNDGFSAAGFNGTRKPRLSIEERFYDPSHFTLEEVELEKQTTTDTERNIRVDLSRDFYAGTMPSQLQFGAKVSRRKKDNDLDVWVFEDFDELGFGDEQLNMTRFSDGNASSGLGRFGPRASSNAVQNLIGGLARDDFFDEEKSRINDFDIREDINAAYIMNTLDIDALRIIAGVRYEGTQLDARGTGLNEGVFEASRITNDYHHWLPGLHGIYQLNPDTQIRAAWTNTVVRPTFGQLFPGFVLDGDEAEFGNPRLEPLESTNFDLGIEHYMGRAGAVSAFVFYKDIENFIYAADVAGTGDFVDFDEAFTSINGDKAKVYGLELAYSQKFNWLPSPWNGLLLSGNSTFTRSKARIDQFDPDLGAERGRNISLPGQSDITGNLTLGWENNRLSLRLSSNYKSAYLDEVGDILDKRYDYQVDDQLFVDFSASYFLTDTLQVFFEAQNLTDESYYVYTGSRRFNAQYEEYGPTYKVGLRLSQF